MRIQFLKLQNWLILSLMSILGTQGCRAPKSAAHDKNDDAAQPRDEIMLMYGAPSSSFSDKDAVKPDEAEKNEIKPRQEVPVMYGVPTVNYIVKGRVVDQSGKPVKGAQVILLNNTIDAEPGNVPDNDYVRAYVARASDTTDANGQFNCHTTDMPEQPMRVLVRDIDGAKNGKFENQVLDVEFGEPEGGSGNWKLGERKAEVTVKMKRKK